MNTFSPLFKELNNYFDTCIDMICSRCSGNLFNKKQSWYPHHDGIINAFLIPSHPISDLFYKNYIDDHEHGLFHGMMCGFIIFLLHRDPNIGMKNVVLEHELSSAFLHDFLKCNGFSQEDHDHKLSEYYPHLHPVTYTHSTPINSDDSYLILADRIELTRYTDYNEWVDERYRSIFTRLSPDIRTKIDTFYSAIRPILFYFYKNREQLFIRHGLEVIEKGIFDKDALFPPKDSYVEMGNGYPIETDSPPFGVLENWKSCKTNGACSNHSMSTNWNKVKGYITFREFIDKNGKIINTGQRDHVYASSNIMLQDWVFMYQNIAEDDYQIQQLIENDIRIIPQPIINKMFTFIKLFRERLLVLNGCV